MGDVLKVTGSSWEMTGFPPLAGRVEKSGARYRLVIEEIGGQTRQETADSPGAKDVEARLKELDAKLVFEIQRDGGKLTLKQVGSSDGFAEWRFEKQG
jgi:hypothetical protein